MSIRRTARLGEIVDPEIEVIEKFSKLQVDEQHRVARWILDKLGGKVKSKSKLTVLADRRTKAIIRAREGVE
ncbi:hypothetical protein LCGC14_2986410, partial [marine sediment metagenome]